MGEKQRMKTSSGNDSFEVSLVCPKNILRINQSITITALIQGKIPDPELYTFRWWASKGQILQLPSGYEARYTAPAQKLTASVNVEAKNKNGAISTRSVSIIIYKQLGFFKADDMQCSNEKTVLPNWKKFLDYMQQQKIKASVGLIGNSLEKGNAVYVDYIKNISQLEYFEIFNHGYDHVLEKINEKGELYSEFFNTPMTQQKEHLEKTQNLAKQKLNDTIHTFGAPGNHIDSNTTLAVESVADLKIWFYGNPCSKLGLNKWGKVEISTGTPDYNAFIQNYDPSVDYYVYQFHPNGFTDTGFDNFKKILAYLIQQEMTFLLPYEYYLLIGGNATAVLSLSRTGFNFGCDMDGHRTPTQALQIDSSSGVLSSWATSCSASWISISPASGTGPTASSISINSTGLPSGTYNGTISIAAPNASNSPHIVNIELKVFETSSTAAPFGDFATPGEDSVVSGSIPVTGWALDDIGVQRVMIYNDQAYIGDAVFVEGARPDVEAAYPGYPQNYKSGWGYMLLTNCLPGGGNSVYTLIVYATDVEGRQTKLSAKTISVDNKNSVKPFGAIDTPAQGGVASGSKFVNFGWALTPLPNTIPKDGSTIYVLVDDNKLGSPVYNIYREDIEKLFPGYNNSGGASGYFILDTTLYKNGVHTIAWIVSDDKGNTDGIGSRFFTIEN